jgi:hypothetical protein
MAVESMIFQPGINAQYKTKSTEYIQMFIKEFSAATADNWRRADEMHVLTTVTLKSLHRSPLTSEKKVHIPLYPMLLKFLMALPVFVQIALGKSNHQQ